MHCKNFSLLDKSGIGYVLSPAYDLLAVWLTGIKDRDELAMPLVGYGVDDRETIGGFNRHSFIEAMELSGIAPKIAEKIIVRLIRCRGKWLEAIECSFLSEKLKMAYKELLDERLLRLGYFASV